jgi:GNAT superfamily N-acetyltransferase
MAIEIREFGPEALDAIDAIPIAFRVETVLVPVDEGLGGIRLREKPVEPYVKDFGPVGRLGAMAGWGFFLAAEGGRNVGGAVTVCGDSRVRMLDRRDDLTVLWDIRVAPDHRRRGVGTRLFERAVAWARERGCRCLKVETSSVDVPACRFYARRGCRLGAIHRHAYAHEARVAHETMLLWYLDLEGR